MAKEDILKKYVCTTPFKYLEVHKGAVFSCCPSWLPNKISTLENIKEAWDSIELKEVQDSILDGSYKYCSKTQCPYLSQLLIDETIPSRFIEKEHFKIEKYKDGPININFAFLCFSIHQNLPMHIMMSYWQWRQERLNLN
jgi:hypothetical protein